MTKNITNGLLNFEISQLLSLKKSEQIPYFLEKHKDLLNSQKFDSSVQNLCVLQFIHSKNINFFFFNQN